MKFVTSTFVGAFLAMARTTQSFTLGGHRNPLILPVSLRTTTSTTLQVSNVDQEVPIILNGVNIDLTPALIEYVQKRIGGPLRKLARNGAVQECDVVLSVNKNPKVKDSDRVEVITNLKGTTIICKTESPDMYASIDDVAKALSRKLLKYKENRIAGWHGGKHMGDDLMEALEADEDWASDDDGDADSTMMATNDYVDPGKPTITKIKSFDTTKPISVDEAIFALDYVDHDFYVFRNEVTNKISVVYKRNTGGIGLIEPED